MELIRLKVESGLVLEQLVLGHAPELFAEIRASRQHLGPWLTWVEAATTEKDTRSFIRSIRKVGLYQDGLVFVIRKGEQLAGTIGFGRGSIERRKVEMGYWLGQSFVGQGVATRSCRRCIEYAFSETNVNRLEIRCQVENRKSWAIPERLGFIMEGVEREGAYVGGTYRDLRVYSLLRREWYGSS